MNTSITQHGRNKALQGALFSKQSMAGLNGKTENNDTRTTATEIKEKIINHEYKFQKRSGGKR